MKKMLIILISMTGYVYAQTWADTASAIDQIFSRYKANEPGIQLAISRNGQVLYSKAWGMADMEHQVPLTIASPIEAGSVSKQFTAAAILLLEQQGKLSLNDDVHKYIPELPDYGSPITLYQMMTHTSGFRDWGSIAAMTGWPRSTKTYSNEDALYIAARQKSLNHKPGAEFLYSNTNYNLFAVIVQRVSGLSLSDFSDKYIFKPAGMTNTQWRSNFKKIVPNRAIAYSYGSNGYETEMPNEYVYGNGGLLTTAEDLLKWNHYYASGKFGSPSLLTRQITTLKKNNGIMNQYAAGLFIDQDRGWKQYKHDGATAGYRSNLEYYPELGLGIAIISNTSRFDTSNHFPPALVAHKFLVDKTTPAVKQPPLKVIEPLTFSNRMGWYRNPISGAGTKILMRDGKLYSSSGTLLMPASENELMAGRNRLLFNTKDQIQFISPGNDTFYLNRVDSAVISDITLQEYTGKYYSDEVDAWYTARVKNGKLEVHQDPDAERILTPTYKDAFTSGGLIVWFERDKKNKVSGMRMSVGRARNVLFVRKS